MLGNEPTYHIVREHRPVYRKILFWDMMALNSCSSSLSPRPGLMFRGVLSQQP